MRQVLITGASSDIGIELCRHYSDKAYRVIAHYNNGQDAFLRLLDENKNIAPLQIDFSKSENVERGIAKNRELITASDVLINAAAILEPQPFADLTADAILKSLSINLIPGLLLMRTLAPEMVARGWGRIVQLSSIGVKFRGGSSSYNYALSKHALEFFPADHIDWASHNVFVNAIRVGVTDTRFHRNDPTKDIKKRISLIPAGRMATTEEIAQAVYALGSDDNTFTTGQIIAVAGGE
jgi:NAD(P)-dependent dehydrogenase (short-subunit alcohol dehydrogenase family)